MLPNVKTDAPPDDLMLAEAQRIRSSGVLGEARLRRLFDYLIDASMAGRSPKELSIAIDVFGKGADFSAAEDALVRVYIHKLRKALSEFYAAQRGSLAGSLQLPKGDYRIRLQMPDLSPAVEKSSAAAEISRWRLPANWLAGLGAVTLACALWVSMRSWQPADEAANVRGSPVWSSILADDRQIEIVMGDYYLVGETDNDMTVKRLVREFDINSRSDLDEYLMEHPDKVRHLTDVGMRYLPTASADALRHVMAILAPADRRIHVHTISEFPAENFKNADVIYIGFVSGLGMLQSLVFESSRLRVGASFDELIDTQTGKSFISQSMADVLDAQDPLNARETYHDYGLFEKLRGPGGGTFIVIAGTRDEGVRQTAEAFTSAKQLPGLTRSVDARQSFETLLDVRAFEQIDLNGRVIFTAQRH